MARGCTYYSDGAVLPEQPVAREAFSDAELAVALLHPALRYDPRTIRLGFDNAPEETGRSQDVDGIVPMAINGIRS